MTNGPQEFLHLPAAPGATPIIVPPAAQQPGEAPRETAESGENTNH